MGIPGCVPIIKKTLNNSSASCTNTKMQLTYTDTNTDTNTNTNTNKNTNKTWSLKKHDDAIWRPNLILREEKMIM